MQTRLMMLRIRKGSVHAYFEGAVSGDRRTYLAIGYINQCLAGIHSYPAMFCQMQKHEYSLAFQTTDTALADLRSIAVGRRRGHMGSVHLVPDFYFIQRQGYAALRRAALEGRIPGWSEREDLVFWRGSTTGWGSSKQIGELPRIRLALMCRDVPHTDVGILGVSGITAAHFPIAEVEKFVAGNGIMRDRIPILKHSSYKYAIDIDGMANAWSLFEKLLLGCCVLKVESPFEQWFYHRIEPWVHFVPVRGDLSDLAEKADWCLSHGERCADIAARGAAVASSLVFDSEVEYGLQQILRVVSPDLEA